jgi:hypothetical protein
MITSRQGPLAAVGSAREGAFSRRQCLPDSDVGMNGAYHFGRGLHEATKQKASGQFDRYAGRIA